MIITNDLQNVTYSQPAQYGWGQDCPPLPGVPSKQPEPTDVLRFTSSGQPVSADSLWKWARANYPRMFADPKVRLNILQSNEFSGSDDARKRAIDALALKLREQNMPL